MQVADSVSLTVCAIFWTTIGQRYQLVRVHNFEKGHFCIYVNVSRVSKCRNKDTILFYKTHRRNSGCYNSKQTLEYQTNHIDLVNATGFNMISTCSQKMSTVSMLAPAITYVSKLQPQVKTCKLYMINVLMKEDFQLVYDNRHDLEAFFFCGKKRFISLMIAIFRMTGDKVKHCYYC